MMELSIKMYKDTNHRDIKNEKGCTLYLVDVCGKHKAKYNL